MNALENKLLDMVICHKKRYNYLPKFVRATIRWNDTKEYVHDTIFCFDTFDIDSVDDDKIFFYCEGVNGFMPLLANIYFTAEDFDSMDDFFAEVDKYDTDNENDLDWSYLHRGEDFCVVDVEDVFDEL